MISLSAEWFWTRDYYNSNRVLCRYKHPGPPPQVQNDFSFTVVPGPFNASRCSFSNLPSSTVAGTSTVISIVSRDYHGNPRTSSNDFFQVTVVGPDSVRTTFSTADPNQAQYTSTFTPSVAGTYSVNIRIKGADIEGSPAKLTVNPAVANAAKSSVYGDGLVTAIAGSTAVFKISLRDEFGNMRTAGGEVNSLGIVFEGSTNTRPLELSNTDNQDGTYTIRFIGRGENQHKITPTLNNVVIGTGFYSVDVLPGALSAPNSFVVGLGTSKAFPNSVASIWNRFTIQGRDQYNNTLRAPVNAFAVSVTYPDGTIRYLQTNDDVFYNHAGSHLVLWRSTTAGAYSISVSYNSDPIYNSAFSIIIDPGAAFGPTSCVVHTNGCWTVYLADQIG